MTVLHRSMLAALVLSSTTACGTRTQLEVDPTGPGAADAGRDAGDRDAGRRDAGPPDAGPAGPECERDEDCGGERCVLAEGPEGRDLEPALLRCGAGAGPPARAECGDRTECGRGLCVAAGTCVAACVDDSDCGTGEECRDLYVRTGPSALQPLRGCVPPVVVPDDVMVERELRAGALSGSMDTLELPSSGAVQTFVFEKSRGIVQLASLATRHRRPIVLFDPLDHLDPTSAPPLNAIAFYQDIGTGLIPNGPLSPPSPRGYLMELTSTRRADLLVTRLVRSTRGTILDLDIFYVGGGRLEPSGDRGPSQVSVALDRFETLYAPARVRIGVVRQHRVVGGLRDRFTTIEADADDYRPELGEMFALSAGAAGPSIAVFLVRSLDIALGIAGGIPGAAGVPGTPGSGVAAAVDALGTHVVEIDLGRVLAHEIGHFLGLIHPTEVTGHVLESLPDTPSCPISRDADGDGLLLPEECAGFGDDNIMFWAAAADVMTADQAAVVRTSPVLRR